MPMVWFKFFDKHGSRTLARVFYSLPIIATLIDAVRKYSHMYTVCNLYVF